ncbi:MAG TPA: hypothetical protein VMB19_10055 [Silvibacterium sp.]|nr:hypothetical protein [Silvibacterium sp.]
METVHASHYHHNRRADRLLAGKKLNSLNDVVFALDGSKWFTDPPFGLKAYEHKELPSKGVFRYAHGKPTGGIPDLTLPDLIGFSPDGKRLYVPRVLPLYSGSTLRQ